MAELTVQESRIELQKLADEVAAYYTTDAMEERTEKFTFGCTVEEMYKRLKEKNIAAGII